MACCAEVWLAIKDRVQIGLKKIGEQLDDDNKADYPFDLVSFGDL